MPHTNIIYIIDDDQVYQFTARKALEKLKSSKKVFIFSDGEEAIDFLEEHIDAEESQPDYIFLDLNMPVMDGWEFLEEFSQLKNRLMKNVIIYIVSSSNDDLDTNRAKKIEEVTGYLIKPIHPSEFSKILDNL